MKTKTPSGLGAAGKKFYKQIVEAYVEFESAHDVSRLIMACGCLDKISADEKIIKLEGRYIEDRFHQKREHPAAKAIRDNTIVFCRIIRELGLDINTPGDSRPPRQY